MCHIIGLICISHRSLDLVHTHVQYDSCSQLMNKSSNNQLFQHAHQGFESYSLYSIKVGTRCILNINYWDHVYWRHPRSSVDRLSIDTFDRHLHRPSIDTRSTLDRHSIDISVDSRSTVDWFSQTRRRVSIDTSSDHAFSVGRHSADVSIATLWSAVGGLSVACRWPVDDISV